MGLPTYWRTWFPPFRLFPGTFIFNQCRKTEPSPDGGYGLIKFWETKVCWRSLRTSAIVYILPTTILCHKKKDYKRSSAFCITATPSQKKQIVARDGYFRLTFWISAHKRLFGSKNLNKEKAGHVWLFVSSMKRAKSSHLMWLALKAKCADDLCALLCAGGSNEKKVYQCLPLEVNKPALGQWRHPKIIWVTLFLISVRGKSHWKWNRLCVFRDEYRK